MNDWSADQPQDEPSPPPLVMATTSSAIGITVREVLD